MASDMANAYDVCIAFLYDSNSTTSAWWWDEKGETIYSDDETCTSLVSDLEDYEEYDELSGAGTVLALNR